MIKHSALPTIGRAKNIIQNSNAKYKTEHHFRFSGGSNRLGQENKLKYNKEKNNTEVVIVREAEMERLAEGWPWLSGNIKDKRVEKIKLKNITKQIKAIRLPITQKKKL